MTIPCKTVTPMFLAGAYQEKGDERPELRAPSVRGLLHWWFRAVVGGYLADHAAVRQHEQRLFGGAGDADSGSASAVTVRVRGQITSAGYRPLLHADRFTNQQEQRRRSFKFQGIDPGTIFSVGLSDSPYSRLSDALPTAKALFDLAATLGGLGRRSRRGFGAFQPVDRTFANKDDVEEQARAVIRAAQEKVKTFVGAAAAQPFGPNPVAEYPTLHDAVADVNIGTPTDWEILIANLMWEIHDRKNPGYTPAADRLYRKVLGDGNDRQASTLWVSVVQLKDGQVVPIYTQFYCRTRFSPTRGDFAAIQRLPSAVSSSLTAITFPAP